MKKVKLSVPQEDWGSLNTKYPAGSNRVQDNEFTEGTSNIDTNIKGSITKRKGGVTYSTLPSAPKDQYEAIFSDGVRHLLTVDNGTLRYSPGNGAFTQVLAGLAATVNNEFATTQDRVYFGNGVQKKVYDRTTSYGGVTYTFPTQTTKDLGAIAPTTAPTAAVAAGGSIPVGTYTYKVTFLYYDFEESNGGTASNTVTTTGGNQTVNLTVIPIGGYGVTARKIYRGVGGVYTFVGVISNNTATTFSDTIAAGTTPIPEDNNVPPDFTLIKLYLDRLFLAGIPGDPYFIFFSEPGYPDVFLSNNYIPCNQEDPITGIIVYLDRLIVFNRRSMGQILGRTSDQFRYAEIEGSVGCVDNRSMQIRVINGVPVLIWLSDKGIYAYNGNSVVYISDKIEDQINFNIQQSVIQKNKVTQSSYTDFTQGTSSNGINLESAQGTITNKGPYWDTVAHPLATYEEQTNPKKAWDTTTEWENSGASKTDLATRFTVPQLSNIQDRRFDGGGAITGDIVYSGNSYSLPVSADHTGIAGSGSSLTQTVADIAAQPVVLPRAGNITSIRVDITDGFSNIVLPPPSTAYRVFVARDSGNTPNMGSLAYDSGLLYGTNPVTPTERINIFAVNIACATNERVWIGVQRYGGPNGNEAIRFKSASGGILFSERPQMRYNGSWQQLATNGGALQRQLDCAYVFVVTPIAKNGSWVSDVYDSHAVYNSTLLFQAAGVVHPSNYGTKVSTIILEASNDGVFFTAIKTLTYPSTSSSVTLSGHRYYRARLLLSTTDNRETQLYNRIAISFPTTATWVSEPIDCTSDVTGYQSLIISDLIPAFSGITYTAATSDDNITYTAFQAIGSVPVKRWIKLQAVLTKLDTIQFVGTVSIPAVYSILLKWNITTSFISKALDTGVTPAGWDLFQASFSTNSGTVNFFMRSAATQGGLTGASWYAVTNGTFPPSALPVLQWVQWKVEITSNPDQIPTIDSVTINWFIGSSGNNIRCASIFYNTNYYLSVAEFGNTINNVVFVLDQEGKWRVYRDLNIGTLSYFFNIPYYGNGVNSRIVKFLEGTDDSGSAIAADIRFKAFDFSSEEEEDDKLKMLENVTIFCSNTGATFTASFSTDEGVTYYDLKDNNGNSTWTVGTDGKPTRIFLRPDYTSTIPTGYSIMLRLYNNDTKEIEVDKFKMSAFVRKHSPQY